MLYVYHPIVNGSEGNMALLHFRDSCIFCSNSYQMHWLHIIFVSSPLLENRNKTFINI